MILQPKAVERIAGGVLESVVVLVGVHVVRDHHPFRADQEEPELNFSSLAWSGQASQELDHH